MTRPQTIRRTNRLIVFRRVSTERRGRHRGYIENGYPAPLQGASGPKRVYCSGRWLQVTKVSFSSSPPFLHLG